MKSNKRTLVLLVLLALVAVIGVPIIKNNFSQGEVIGNTTSESAAGEIVKVLEDIQKIELDFSILNSSELNYLYDFSLPLVNIPIGRTNPFAR